jgi:hypothetical protein
MERTMAEMKKPLRSVARRVARAMGFQSKRERVERLAADAAERAQAQSRSESIGHTAEENERAGHRYLRP